MTNRINESFEETEARFLKNPVIENMLNPGVDPYSQYELFYPHSSVSRVKYLHDTLTLEVEFKTGAIYHYSAVPKEIFEELSKSESPGKLVHTTLKSFEYKKIK